MDYYIFLDGKVCVSSHHPSFSKSLQETSHLKRLRTLTLIFFNSKPHVHTFGSSSAVIISPSPRETYIHIHRHLHWQATFQETSLKFPTRISGLIPKTSERHKNLEKGERNFLFSPSICAFGPPFILPVCVSLCVLRFFAWTNIDVALAPPLHSVIALIIYLFDILSPADLYVCEILFCCWVLDSCCSNVYWW